MKYKNSPEVESALAEAYSCNVKPKVAIHCITYNQERFLSKCLDSFVSQQTDFPFVAIVHDDASTDGTAKVLMEYAEKYPDIIKPVCDSINRYTEHSLEEVMISIIRAYNPDYVAMCEGDDYWTDPYKLQKQVDYMDKNPDCSLCHGDVMIYEDSKKKMKGRKGIMFSYSNLYKEATKKDIFWELLNYRYAFQPLTFMYRLSAYDNIEKNNISFMMGDMPLILDLSKQGHIKYFSSVLGVYNHNVGSATRNKASRLKFDVSAAEMRIFYCNKYGYKVPPKVKKTFDIAYIRLFLKEGGVESLYKPFNKWAVNVIANFSNYGNIKKIILFWGFINLLDFLDIWFSKIRIVYYISANYTYYRVIYNFKDKVEHEL